MIDPIPSAPVRGTVWVGFDADENARTRRARAAVVAKYKTAQEHHYPRFAGEGAWLVTVELAEYQQFHPEAKRLMPLPNADGTDFEGSE